jgi:hypothetical protein
VLPDVNVEAEVGESLVRSKNTVLGINGETQRVKILKNIVDRN